MSSRPSTLVFNRRVDFFQVRRDQGENTEDFLRCLSKLGNMADLEALSKEELTTFRFIDACDDKRLRDKIFDLKRKDATAIRDTVAQYERQQKAKAALRSKAALVTTVKPPARKGGQRTNRPGPARPWSWQGGARVAAMRPIWPETAASRRKGRCVVNVAEYGSIVSSIGQIRI